MKDNIIFQKKSNDVMASLKKIIMKQPKETIIPAIFQYLRFL